MLRQMITMKTDMIKICNENCFKQTEKKRLVDAYSVS